MAVSFLSRLVAYVPTLAAVLWEILSYIWTYVIWRTPTSYPGGDMRDFLASSALVLASLPRLSLIFCYSTLCV